MPAVPLLVAPASLQSSAHCKIFGRHIRIPKCHWCTSVHMFVQFLYMILFEFGVGFFNRNQVELLTRQQVLTLSTFIHDLVCAGRSPGHPWSWPKNPGWNYCKARQENINRSTGVYLSMSMMSTWFLNATGNTLWCYVMYYDILRWIRHRISTFVSTSCDIIDKNHSRYQCTSYFCTKHLTL